MTSIDIAATAKLKDAAAVVRELSARVGADGIDYKSALAGADKRGFVPFLLFAFVLLLLPIDLVLPQIAGVTMLVCGLGLLGGAPGPWLPWFLAKRRTTKARLDAFAGFLEGQQSWSQLLLMPRHGEFSTGAGERVAALLVIALALAVIAPLPNMLPSLAVLAIALGLLQRDGLVMLIGIAVGIGWIAFLAAMAAGVAASAPFASGWAHENAPIMVRYLGHAPPPVQP